MLKRTIAGIVALFTATSALGAQLTYKASWYGKRLKAIDRFLPTSKTCSTPRCEAINQKLALSDRTWVCTGCGTLHDRDLNAAKNILAAGQAVLSSDAQKACGGDVRPASDSSVSGGPDEAGMSPEQHSVLSAA